ncbi:Heat shock protein [Aspergillus sclerotialis]|uniref:Heat shock protein n=1 Tax=Aspergillus sclerotialis TaxID=2070753 RepID=A0A3A2Z6B7_9EURO|nr:Heat shock protein [Aspergillus sclerotialis]
MSLTRHFHPYHTNEWGSLFRLLDDYNDHLSARGSMTAKTFTPRFDVRETKDAYHLDGELPGISQKEVDIEFTDPHTLVVKGKTQREYSVQPAEGEETSNGHKYWATERSVGEFSRTFNFPGRIDQDRVKASLKNGILAVTIPKAAAPSAKRITIDAE